MLNYNNYPYEDCHVALWAPRNDISGLLAVTVLELLAGAARTRIVTSHLLLHMDRSIALSLTAVGHKVGPAGLGKLWILVLVK